MPKPHYDILFLPLGAASMGGAERSIAYLARGMQDRGKKVLILAERALEPTYYPRFLDELGLAVRWVDWAPGYSNLHNARRAIGVFRSLTADIIQFNISWRRGMWLIPIIARLFSRARLIGTMRAMPDPHQDVPRRTYLGFIRGIQLWRLPGLVVGWLWSRSLDVTVSVNVSDYPSRLERDFGFDRQRICVIHNGVEFREQPISAARQLEVRRSHGIADTELLIGYFGRLAEDKGVHLLLEAMRDLPARYRLIIVGLGPTERSLRDLTRRYALDERVLFLGFVNQPDDLMGTCDIAAVPSTGREAFGRVIVEAMNQGTPVIGSRIGGIPELLTDGVEGRLVEPNSVEELKDAIRQLGENPALRTKLGQAARARVNAEFRLEQVTKKYACLYRDVLVRARAEPVRPGGCQSR
jgi:glycosyltransferase involved in cell wall biosynthesis